ncbi:unnamed protein product [Caenorhabditis auriculariae]|uniref:SSD domain-containing protein n=1 Tax=Caenorhabditis auriculariae TaxID=2777116 RepID=A0A8S1GPW5_9PELO|nr:unnamed protein product [Caenorhabditis auriculariae]
MRQVIVVLAVLAVAAAFVVPQIDLTTLKCLTCVATVTGVELKVKSGEDVLKEDVDKICLKEAPTPAAEKECESIAEDGVEIIVDGIQKNEPPKKICQQMKKRLVVLLGRRRCWWAEPVVVQSSPHFLRFSTPIYPIYRRVRDQPRRRFRFDFDFDTRGFMDLRRSYSRAIFDRPVLFVVVPILITAVLPAVVLHFQPVRLSPNAEVGFDTKDTPYSGPRLAWQRIQSTLTLSNRVNFANPRAVNATATRQPSTRRPDEVAVPSRPRVRRSWADQLLQAINNVACYDAPIPLMDHLSQVVIELDDYEQLYDLNLLEKLCQMHGNISKPLAKFDAFTPYRNIWSVANMFSCISPNMRVNCSQLDADDLKLVRPIVETCWKFRPKIFDCKLKCTDNVKCEFCRGIPVECSSQIIFDLFYRVLPKSMTSRPFQLNTFLPVFTLTGYITQNIQINVRLYDDLENSIVAYTSKNDLKLRGLLMDIKRDRLLEAAIKDSYLAIVAALLVMLVVAIHSESLLYAFAVVLLLALSVFASLAFYAIFTDEFPLLNLVTFVLLIAIGSDDAFLLRTNFPTHIDEDSFHECLMHTAFTMFLTSFSTAVPFFINVTSNVVAFRCFGLFAGVTVIINYLLVVSFLPAFLLVQRKYLDCIPSPPIFFKSQCSHLLHRILPHVLIQGRYIYLSLLTIAAIGGAVITWDGLHLPEYNPLQLFTSSNLHEWYDNNAEKNFEFVAAKIAIPLTARVVWGVQPVKSLSTFKTFATTPLMSDEGFSLSNSDSVKSLAGTLHKFRSLPFVQHEAPFWPERFLAWSLAYPCSQGFLCCNMSHALFSNSYLDFCLRNSTTYLPTSYNDTPIFDNSTFALVGYTAMFPTKLRYNHRFSQLSKSFDFLDQLRPENGWWVPEWWLMSTWYDLLQSIVSDCLSSVIGSVAFVALFAFIQLRLQAFTAVVTITCIIAVSSGIVTQLGWVIGVLEAIILVLVVGLSFDYTLHYGAALPSRGCAKHRIREATVRGVGPVTLAAFTSFLAGASMLFAKTHAFYQVGVFLVVISSTSWVFATFFYLPMLSLTLPRLVDSCVFCEKFQNSLQLEAKI